MFFNIVEKHLELDFNNIVEHTYALKLLSFFLQSFILYFDFFFCRLLLYKDKFTFLKAY